MNTFLWLVKREFWEHRGAFVWTPLITVAAVVAINIMMIIAGEVMGRNLIGPAAMLKGMASVAPEHLHMVGNAFDLTAMMPILLVNFVLFFVLISYCMNTLAKDRKDRSILFWKSLPVSELATVLSKAFCAVIAAPIIATVAGVIGACLIYLILAITAAFHGFNFFEALWTLPHPGHVVGAFVGLLPVFWVWMLPAVGWLMLCSAWSKGRVARWAIALPMGVGAVVSWVGVLNDHFSWAKWFWPHVSLRIFSVFPGSWLWMQGKKIGAIFEASNHSGKWHAHSDLPQLANALSDQVGKQYHLLLTPDFLWGALIGLCLLAAAIWLRRWRTEL